MTELTATQYDAYLAALADVEGLAGVQAEAERQRALVGHLEAEIRRADERLDIRREVGHALSGLMRYATANMEIAHRAELLREAIYRRALIGDPAYRQLPDAAFDQALKEYSDQHRRMAQGHALLVSGKLDQL